MSVISFQRFFSTSLLLKNSRNHENWRQLFWDWQSLTTTKRHAYLKSLNLETNIEKVLFYAGSQLLAMRNIYKRQVFELVWMLLKPLGRLVVQLVGGLS